MGLTTFSVISFLFGTAMDYMNDSLCEEVWNIYWNFLPKSEQEKVMFLLMVTQNPVVFTIGKFAPVCAYTFNGMQ